MSQSTLNVSYSAKTILQKYNETLNSVDLPSNYLKRCTLNFKYSLWPEDLPINPVKLRYFGIGIGGRYNVDSETLLGPYVPETVSMDLYKPIPFRCRPLDEDLDDTTRKLYRIRTIERINGVDYVCYYLKKMELIDSTVQIFRIDPVTNNTIPYELENKYLNPVAKKPSSNNVQESTSPDIFVGVRMNQHITAAEVYEYIDIKFKGDRRYAVLSEYGVYSGEDKIADAPRADGKGQFQYLESVCTSLSYKTCTGGSAVDSESWEVNRQILIGDGQCISLSNKN